MSNADDTQNDTDSIDAEPHQRLASDLRLLADEVERAGRQLGADDIDVDVREGRATIVATYDLTEDYDLDADPLGLCEPETIDNVSGEQPDISLADEGGDA